ncbi:MAG: Fic family protein [Chitinophagaceae bacterium]|jgi:Fic family protein|nr:Fic family protein [Chitinophagaceae bacterium]
MAKINHQEILEYLMHHRGSSSTQIKYGLSTVTSIATIKRVLVKLSENGFITPDGKGKNTTYRLSDSYTVLYPVDLPAYFKKEIDERVIKEIFNFSLMNEVLTGLSLFTSEEELHLSALQNKFTENTSQLGQTEYNKEMERLAIDLSWKSSQIEGNTYSLLETEQLLTERKMAEGKPLADATMLLNHKEAINFILQHKDYLNPLTIRAIEDIHSILVKDLSVDRNIRQRRVGISGTNYKPLDNEYLIREALEDMCRLINVTKNVFEKSLLCLVLLSYIQAFADGNKRTARIASNAILMASDHCPLSFRTVDPIDYKKAMLLFYEQNNISAIKQLFIQQYEFAVNTYF